MEKVIAIFPFLARSSLEVLLKEVKNGDRAKNTRVQTVVWHCYKDCYNAKDNSSNDTHHNLSATLPLYKKLYGQSLYIIMDLIKLKSF